MLEENFINVEWTKIKLLGRIAFGPNPEKEIRAIVTMNKRKKFHEAYIKGYNSCDGLHTMRDIANLIGVSIGTLSPIMNQWEDMGIVYKVGKNYKKLFPI